MNERSVVDTGVPDDHALATLTEDPVGAALTEQVVDARVAEELADVLEVVRALGALAGHDAASLEALRAEKAEERGAFEKRLILVESE